MTTEYAGSATEKKRLSDPMHAAWKPYCLVCSTMERMAERPYGFQCDDNVTEPTIWVGSVPLRGRRGCGNKINWNLTHYDEPTG